MNAASGILTARGGMTSHAALVARQHGQVSVSSGCGAISTSTTLTGTMSVGDTVLSEGDHISLNGTIGLTSWTGRMPTQPSSRWSEVLLEKDLDPRRCADVPSSTPRS